MAMKNNESRVEFKGMTNNDAIVELTVYLTALRKEYGEFGLLETGRRIEAVEMAIRALVKNIAEEDGVYVVVGYENHDNGGLDPEVYGVFSTEELAQECADEIKEMLEYIDHCEILHVLVDEFGYK